MITNKVDVLIVDAVDAKAIQNSVQKAVDQGIKVVAYDRLAEGPISAYTSFDNEEVGRTQGNAPLKALGDKAKKSTKIVMINGSVTDPNAAQFKKGAHSVLDGKVTIAKEYDTKGVVAGQRQLRDGGGDLRGRQEEHRGCLLRQRRHGRRHHPPPSRPPA